MRYGIVVLWMLICPVISAEAQVSIGISLPNLSIGINLPLFPELVPVPGYPVYYAPQVNGNYFFYDGMYWVFRGDNWYASSWYNGPWALVDRYDVPLFILRVPVRYYRQPPVYFHGWRADAPPRWGKHWGHEWEKKRKGWNRWNRGSLPSRAALPLYQRQYSGERYPRAEQQPRVRSEHYRYQPRETVVRRHYYGPRVEHRAPLPAQRGREMGPPAGNPRQGYNPPAAPPKHVEPPGPRPQPMHRDGKNMHGSAPVQPPPQQRGPAFKEQRHQPEEVQREQHAPRQRDGKHEEQGQEREGRGR